MVLILLQIFLFNLLCWARIQILGLQEVEIGPTLGLRNSSLTLNIKSPISSVKFHGLSPVTGMPYFISVVTAHCICEVQKGCTEL